MLPSVTYKLLIFLTSAISFVYISVIISSLIRRNHEYYTCAFNRIKFTACFQITPAPYCTAFLQKQSVEKFRDLMQISVLFCVYQNPKLVSVLSQINLIHTKIT